MRPSVCRGALGLGSQGYFPCELFRYVSIPSQHVHEFDKLATDCRVVVILAFLGAVLRAQMGIALPECGSNFGLRFKHGFPLFVNGDAACVIRIYRQVSAF